MRARRSPRTTLGPNRGRGGACAPAATAEEVRRLEADLREVTRRATQLAAEAGADTRALGQVTDELLYRARRVRMRPFADACEALPRTVRDLTAAAGKEAGLVGTGGRVEALVERATKAGDAG